jgi:hypothetical protein
MSAKWWQEIGDGLFRTMADKLNINETISQILRKDLRKWKKTTPLPEFVSELYRPSDRSLSEKLVPTFADRGCYVVSVTDPHGRIL